MFGLNLRYIIFLFALFLFGVSFFTADFFLPFLKQWKSDKLLNLSKVYQDESISNETNLLEDGVRKARIANLLCPTNIETRENFINLLFRSKPLEALQKWSVILHIEGGTEEKQALLLDRCINTLKNDNLPFDQRRIAAEIAVNQLNTLLKRTDWIDSPNNSLITAELLAETGNPEKAKNVIRKSLENYPTHAESIFLLTRLTVHLKDKESLSFIGSKLAKLASRKSKTGIEAVRHMTLLHVLNPLSKSSLQKCVEILQANPNAEPIDFMRLYALQYSNAEDDFEKSAIVESCQEQFDLDQKHNLLIFSRWLARLGAFNRLTQFLTPTKAKIEEELFKLRMNALAQINDLESIHFEVNNAPIIPERWRLVIESRAFALEGNYKESLKVLDRLLPVLGNDPRLVRGICEYLESANDIKGLTHILQKLIDQPVHQTYALKKLMHHRAASASLEELIGWMSKLSKVHGNDEFFSDTYLYFELLDPFLASPSQKLDSLLNEAKQNVNLRDSPQTRITLALAHLRNRAPDQALVSLGPINQWRNWQNTRSAWRFISSQVFSLNNDSEKSTILLNSIDFSNLDRAEKESLAQLFPQSFPSTQ